MPFFPQHTAFKDAVTLGKENNSLRETLKENLELDLKTMVLMLQFAPAKHEDKIFIDSISFSIRIRNEKNKKKKKNKKKIIIKKIKKTKTKI